MGEERLYSGKREGRHVADNNRISAVCGHKGDLPFYLSALVIGLGYGTMCPSYQSMFINLAPNSRRGTANSSYLTSWDIGAGAGIFSGGYIAQQSSYHTVYWLCFVLCVVGGVIYFLATSRHFSRLKLR